MQVKKSYSQHQRGFGKTSSTTKNTWTLASPENQSGCVAIDTSGEFDWISNVLTRAHQDGNILFVLDDSQHLKRFSKNDVHRLNHLPPSIVASLDTSQSSWADAVHQFVEKEQANTVVSNLRMMTLGGLVVTVIKDTKNNIRLIPSLIRGKGATLYQQFISN